jgi:alkanesulfonate monooxygenase SsuD/methylene tetrahydromethanopterin reductase-like flavin-dependent oxidoreductase (luciferase family)
MMDRFWEAHDLILKAWTSHDGPFNWEGKYFHHRQVNIWPRPYQQPYPPVWITSVTPSSARQVAEKGYVVASFLTGFDGTKAVIDTYRERRAELGLPAPALDRFAFGSNEYPDRSTTLILQVESLTQGPPLELRGPGIDGTAVLQAAIQPADLFERLEINRMLFPRGIDAVLVADDAIVAIPRTTRLVAREG